MSETEQETRQRLTRLVEGAEVASLREILLRLATNGKPLTRSAACFELEMAQLRAFVKSSTGKKLPMVTESGKPIPIGRPNCLASLTFVFTGVLKSLSREEGLRLVKHYGGKVTTTSSDKTSYCILGNEAGNRKLRTLRELGVGTLDEDQLFELIKDSPERDSVEVVDLTCSPSPPRPRDTAGREPGQSALQPSSFTTVRTPPRRPLTQTATPDGTLQRAPSSSRADRAKKEQRKAAKKAEYQAVFRAAMSETLSGPNKKRLREMNKEGYLSDTSSDSASPPPVKRSRPVTLRSSTDPRSITRCTNCGIRPEHTSEWAPCTYHEGNLMYSSAGFDSSVLSSNATIPQMRENVDAIKAMKWTCCSSTTSRLPTGCIEDSHRYNGKQTHYSRFALLLDIHGVRINEI